MRIFWGEMWRYLKPFPLMICGVLVLFWCLLFGKDYTFGVELNYQCYLLSVEYQQRFGDTIDRTELEEIKRDYAAATADLDKRFEELMGEYGVHSAYDYLILRSTMEDDCSDETYREAVEQWGVEGLDERYKQCDAIFEATLEDQAFVEMYYRCMAIDGVVGYFNILDGEKADIENGKGILDDKEVSEAAQAIKKADLEKGKASLINAVWYPHGLGDSYFNWETLMDVLCAVIILGALVKTNITHVNHLRFVTKHGRAIVKEELSAALAITVVINIAVNALFFLLYACLEQNLMHLMNNRMRTGAIEYVYLDVTFFQLMLLYFAKQLLLSLLLTCVYFLIGHVSQNYISALAPAAAVLIALLVWSYRLNYRGEQLYSYGTPIPWIECLPFVLVLAALVILFRRVRKMEMY